MTTKTMLTADLRTAMAHRMAATSVMTTMAGQVETRAGRATGERSKAYGY